MMIIVGIKNTKPFTGYKHAQIKKNNNIGSDNASEYQKENWRQLQFVVEPGDNKLEWTNAVRGDDTTNYYLWPRHYFVHHRANMTTTQVIQAIIMHRYIHTY